MTLSKHFSLRKPLSGKKASNVIKIFVNNADNEKLRDLLKNILDQKSFIQK